MKNQVVSCFKLIVLALAFLNELPLFALTESVGGRTWTYTVYNGRATVGGGTSPGGSSYAISSSSTGSVSIPERLGGYPVKKIGDYAFSNCSGLTSVTIPDSVTSIGSSAFSGCSGLTSVTIPDSVTSIGHSVFRDCSGLTSVTIPDSVTSIGLYAFSRCSGLTSVTIPDSVTSIGSYAFSGCSGLTSVTIPDSVTSIESYAFNRCIKMTEFIVSNDNPTYKSVSGLLMTKDGGELIAGVNGDVVIPNCVESIGSCAFCGYSGLTSVMIPNSVTGIGNYAFGNCSNLTSVTIPQCVCDLSISNCFPHAYNSITNVVVHKDVTYIADGMFAYCKGLKSVYFTGDAPYAPRYIFQRLSSSFIASDSQAPYGLTVYVPKDSTGWMQGDELPILWPNEEYGRRIKYYDGTVPGDDQPLGVIGDARYILAEAPGDRAIASVAVDRDCSIDEFVLSDGKVYDSVLRIANTSDSAVKLTLPDGYSYEAFDDTMPLIIPPNSVNLLTLTRTADKTFLVSRRRLKSIER